jgi:hypothetical protein
LLAGHLPAPGAKFSPLSQPRKLLDLSETVGSGNLNSWDKWILCLNAARGREQEIP